MSHNNDNEISRDEIKKEFQLERMVLFSDAVFAIVITLMAIEIKIPETNERLEGELLKHELLHVLPVVFAYIVSFVFIGITWYQHLKIFSLLKDYDKGLVVRNLVLLFFIGLFPFSASVITRAKGTSIAFFIYLGVILCCIISQYFLQYYILVQRPALRVKTDLKEHLEELRNKKILVIGFATAFLLCVLTFQLVSDAELRSLAPLWIVPVVVVYRILKKRRKK